MSPVTALIASVIVLVIASLAGGWVAGSRRLSHRGMQLLLSFVAGLLGGLAALVLLPEATAGLSVKATMAWATGGFVGIVVLERLACFHHHETPGGDAGHDCCGHDHGSRLATPAAFAGLSIHGALAGLALGVAMRADVGVWWPAGVFLLAIALHKPFDGLTVVAVARRDGLSRARRWQLNVAYAFVTPAAAIVGFVAAPAMDPASSSIAMAVAAGLLLALALGDLLPEVQSHDHDRLLLTVMLVAGLAAAVGVGALHDLGHAHQDHGHVQEGHHQDHGHDHGHDH